MGATPTRTIRVPDDLWDEARRLAAVEGRTVTDVIIAALRRFVAR